tara:strand:- start:57 stop:836 length:780 start_codon:yes stop_codon:yes gene_type:complete
MINYSLQKGALAFGCARLESLSTKMSSRIIEECLNNDILHFDTAPSYGSEGLIGDILRGVDGSTITSKVGLPRESSNNLFRKIYKRSIKKFAYIAPSIKNKISLSLNKNSINYEQRVLGIDEIMFDLEKTLTNINRSKLDILLVHEPNQFLIDYDLIEIFENLKKQGLIENYGLGYGRATSQLIEFGNVRQVLYQEGKIETKSSINIVHGLIRESLSKGNTGVQHSQFINNFMLKNQNASVLFSASSINQIKEICSTIS